MQYIIMFYNFYVTHIRYKNYKLLCRNSIALSYFCATNIVVLQRLFIIRKRILMPQNLTKKTIKMPQKIAKKPQKKPKKALIKALKPISPKNIY